MKLSEATKTVISNLPVEFEALQIIESGKTGNVWIEKKLFGEAVLEYQQDKGYKYSQEDMNVNYDEGFVHAYSIAGRLIDKVDSLEEFKKILDEGITSARDALNWKKKLRDVVRESE